MKIKNVLPAPFTTPALTVLFLLAACAEGPVARTTGAGRRWVGPVVNVPTGGQFHTVIHYGPWQCSNQLMNYCREKCSGEGYALRGCMWLADVKMDFQGTVLDAGTRFGMTHCCCNYDPLSVSQTESARGRWDNIRDGFRNRWAERFGAWPTDASGKAYPGHHVRDLKHGGNPTDWDNIIPFPKDIHDTLNKLYNQCYAGTPPWTQVGVDYPYGE
jgi:hypothetical protein